MKGGQSGRTIYNRTMWFTKKNALGHTGNEFKRVWSGGSFTADEFKGANDRLGQAGTVGFSPLGRHE